jgi:hypothetical protein
MVRSSAAAFLGFAVAILLIVVGKDGGGGVWATRTDAQFAQCCTQHGVPQATKGTLISQKKINF